MSGYADTMAALRDTARPWELTFRQEDSPPETVHARDGESSGEESSGEESSGEESSGEETVHALEYLQTAVGVARATFPTSSSACMIRLIRATGNFVLTSSPWAGSVVAMGMTGWTAVACSVLIGIPIAGPFGL